MQSIYCDRYCCSKHKLYSDCDSALVQCNSCDQLPSVQEKLEVCDCVGAWGGRRVIAYEGEEWCVCMVGELWE